jgi:hypothetical protein
VDDVAVDAKRILLRYGAPIDVLDGVGEVERIELARFIAKTLLPERERRLRQVLADRGYMEPPTVKTRKSRAKVAQRPAAQGPLPSAVKEGVSEGAGARAPRTPPKKVTVAGSKAAPKPTSRLKTTAKAKPKAKPKVAAKGARKR